MALDNAAQGFLAQMAQFGVKPLHEMTVSEARDFLAASAAQMPQGPEVGAVATRRMSVAGGEIDLLTIRPVGETTAVIVFYHSGGFVIGTAAGAEALGRHLARRTGSAVVLVDYRKAPEYPYPTPVDDAYAALEWVDAHLEELAGRRVPLVVMGESAGGNLAAVAARRARDRQGPHLALQVLLYPVTGADTNTESYNDPANQLMLTKDAMVWFWDLYAPDAARRQEADASPLNAADLSGLPPAIVLTAGHDPLRTEGEAYAARLVQAGVPVAFKRYDDQFHGFFGMVNVLPASEESLALVCGLLKLYVA